MSHATTASASTSTPALASGLSGLPWWHSATPEQRAALERDMRYSVLDDAGPHIPADEYLEELAEYPDAAEYLSGVLDGADAYPNLNAVVAATEAAEPAAAPEEDRPDEGDCTPAEEDAPAPTATVKQCQKTLERFTAALRAKAGVNFEIQALAYQYVQEHLGCAPGKSLRSVAVDQLAQRWYAEDEDSWLTATYQDCRKRLTERVNTMLAVHAVCTLIGDGTGLPKAKKGKGADPDGLKQRLSWSTLRELRPLVYREEDDHTDRWHVLPCAAGADAKAKQLLRTICSGPMTREEVIKQVRGLLLEDALLEYRAAVESKDARRIDAARKMVVAYGGQLPGETPAAETPTGTTKPAETPKGETKPAAAEEPADDADDDDAGEEEGEEQPAEENAKPAPSPESRQGKNLLLSAKNATPKDAAGMISAMVLGHDDPHAVLCELAQAITTAKHDTLTPDAILDALLTGLNLAHLPGKAGRAVKAARQALAARDAG